MYFNFSCLHFFFVSVMSVMASVADKKLTGLVAATFTPLTPQGWVVLTNFCLFSIFPKAQC